VTIDLDEAEPTLMQHDTTAGAPDVAQEAEEAGVPTLGDRIYAAPALLGRHIALLAASIASCGSLYMSEVLGWIPCLLCWYQRILMYPLAVLLLIGILRRDRGLHWYVLPLSIGGVLTSLYHYLLVMTDWFPAPPCNTGVPCTVDYINMVGAFSFVKVPFLALTAFVIITVFTLFSALYQAEDDPLADDPAALPAAPAGTLDASRAGALAVVALVVLAFVAAGAA
jgi:disulfide bond formation protein DsbB